MMVAHGQGCLSRAGVLGAVAAAAPMRSRNAAWRWSSATAPMRKPARSPIRSTTPPISRPSCAISASRSSRATISASAALERKIGEFSDALDGAGVGLFYYAGHGLQVDGRNFIVPVDARLDVPAKLRLETVQIDDILDIMEQQTTTSLVFLDACRNNPFVRKLKRTATNRSAVALAGLAQFDSTRGSFIAFSTAPGSVAMDGAGRNSPFATALLRHIAEPGQSINDLMIAVRRDVVSETATPSARGSRARCSTVSNSCRAASRPSRKPSRPRRRPPTQGPRSPHSSARSATPRRSSASCATNICARHRGDARNGEAALRRARQDLRRGA